MFIAAGWIVGLAGVVGIGWAGTRTALAPPPAEALVTSGVPVDGVALADGWLRLDAPARQDEVVRTRSIFVRGQVGPAVAEVWVGLESRTGKILASRTIRVSGGAAASMPYEAQFRLASPRATGRLFVTATAIGQDGVPTQSIRRRIETNAAPAPPDDPRGPDLTSDPRADGLHRGPHADLAIDSRLVELAGP